MGPCDDGAAGDLLYLRQGDPGGSDFHGERVKPDISLSALDLDISWAAGRGV